MEDRTVNITTSTTRTPNPTTSPRPPICCYPARILANFAIWWGLFLTPAYLIAVGLGASQAGSMTVPIEPPLAGLAMTVLASWIGEADPHVRVPVRAAFALNAIPQAVVALLWMMRVGLL
jgi:hypothetical protein